MHTVELLEEALQLARQCGFQIRHEWLGGVGGGACEFSGQRWIFVDLALNAIEQLEQVTTALRSETIIHTLEVVPALRPALGCRRAAA